MADLDTLYRAYRLNRDKRTEAVVGNPFLNEVECVTNARNLLGRHAACVYVTQEIPGVVGEEIILVMTG